MFKLYLYGIEINYDEEMTEVGNAFKLYLYGIEMIMEEIDVVEIIGSNCTFMELKL